CDGLLSAERSRQFAGDADVVISGSHSQNTSGRIFSPPRLPQLGRRQSRRRKNAHGVSGYVAEESSLGWTINVDNTRPVNDTTTVQKKNDELLTADAS